MNSLGTAPAATGGARRERGAKWAIVWLATFLAAMISARGEMVYGGFAFAGNAAAASEAYRYSVALDRADPGGGGVFETVAQEAMRRHRAVRPDQEIVFGLTDISKCPRVLVLAMTEERVLREQFGAIHKLVVQLGFELLVLNFEERRIVCSVPLFIELIDAQKDPFSEEAVVHRIGEMVRGESSQLRRVLAAKLAEVHARERGGMTLRVSRVTVGEKALPFLPEALRGMPALYAQSVAQQFGSLLTAQAGVALLPYGRDGATAKMALRFADACELSFEIPEPTFAVDLDLRGFKKVLDRQTEAETLWIYGAFLGVKIYEPAFAEVYFEGMARHPVAKVVPRSQTGLDEFPIVSEALKGAILSGIEMIQKDKRTKEKVISKCLL